MSNPWLSFWLSVANSWAGAARGFWTAELRRQQSAMVNEMARQTLRFWTQALAQPDTGRKPRRRR
ncbi:MAG TPA: hypothetical protein VHQ91_01590 [Geminicoccaceae bacterium]|jgi:hypothetical protein|nr:hypothetical protein [Geminicoccaceae bacterium]